MNLDITDDELAVIHAALGTYVGFWKDNLKQNLPTSVAALFEESMNKAIKLENRLCLELY